MNVDLSEEQTKALTAMRDHVSGKSRKPFVLNGLAGTGKTTVLSAFAKEFPNSILSTLTGKAASILRRKTMLPACTIHSAFYQLTGESVVRGKAQPVFKRFHVEDELSGRIVLIDECSMISHEIASDILSTGAKIIACGDPGQLQPVSGKRYFDWSDFTLSTIHRQALESPIIRQAHAVRSGGEYREDGQNFRVLNREATDQAVLDADAILCFRNKTKDAANRYAREVRKILSSAPQVGEPIVCLKNASDFGIFNGGIYNLERPFLQGDTEIHLNVDDEMVSVPQVRFAGLENRLKDPDQVLTHFDFGYAMTVHKAQGSEWRNVLLLDEYPRNETRTEWVYTGITRAADRITIVR